MAFRRVTNTNTYAPSMRPLSEMNPTALSGLLDRENQLNPQPIAPPFNAANAAYGGTPQIEVSVPRPKPEARQSVWQYPSSTMSMVSPVTRSLMAPEPPSVPMPIAEAPEVAAAAAAQNSDPEADPERDRKPRAWDTFQSTVIPIPELERLQYYGIAPVQPRRLA